MKNKTTEKPIENLSYIKILRDNISNLDTIPSKLQSLDFSERENDENIKLLKSECPINLEEYGAFDQIGFLASEYKTEKIEMRNNEGRVIGSVNDITIRPNFGPRERKSFEKKYSRFITGLENLYKIQYWITEERKFLIEQLIKSPQASIQDQKKNKNGRINWQKKFMDFAYLIDALKKNGFITESYKEIVNCFAIQGETKTVKNLSDQVYNITHGGDYQPSTEIQDIVKGIKADKK